MSVWYHCSLQNCLTILNKIIATLACGIVISHLGRLCYVSSVLHRAQNSKIEATYCGKNLNRLYLTLINVNSKSLLIKFQRPYNTFINLAIVSYVILELPNHVSKQKVSTF